MIGRVLSLILFLLLPACASEVSDAPDAIIDVTKHALGPSPDTGCQFFSSAGRDYWFCAPLRSWQTARTKCQAVNLDLVSIGSSTENQFVTTHLLISSWIGANDITTEGQWRWAQSNTQFWQGAWNGSAVGGAYKSWSLLQPDNLLNQDCGTTSALGVWTDEACATLRPYVCEGVVDLCGTDPNKVAPGQCGCGNPDTDSDNDGTANCNDGCVNDPGKIAPGVCGCGASDVDSDGDGAANCIDACPNDRDASEASDLPCSPDGNCVRETFNGFKYFFCNNHRTWDEARQSCEAIGFQLARIDSAQEDAFIVQHLPGLDNWVGGSDLASEGTWTWEFGTETFWQGGQNGAGTGLYVNWEWGQPNNLWGNEDCLVIDWDGEWRDDACDESEPYVCEQVYDACPDDPAKVEFGSCGCGVPETDADGDGVPACLEDCDHDPTRLTLGQCGCVGEPFPRPAGYECSDAFCPGAAPAVCDGAGSCGTATLSECIPSSEPSRGCQVRVYDGHAYLFCTDGVSHASASDYCNAAGMELVGIDDSAEDAFVASRLSAASWIGGSDAVNEGQWLWLDGDELFWQGNAGGTLAPGAFANWASGEPTTNTNDNCAMSSVSSGTPSGWSDQDCDDAHDFVCEVVDQCPTDPLKTKSGYCGCEVPEDIVIMDGREVVVCTDQCPDDATKIAPGKCGCGMPESLCPLECVGNLADPSSPVYGKLQAGRCGCDVPDVDTDNNGTLDCFEGTRQCGTAVAPVAAGTPCDDSICPQQYPVTTVCNGAGACGNPSSCAPTGGGACFWRVFREHVYWFCDGLRTRENARAICGSDGTGYLLAIDDDAENEFIAANITGDSWTGGNQAAVPGQWWWANAISDEAKPFWDGDANGRPHRGVAYANWETGAPASGQFVTIRAIGSEPGSWRSGSGADTFQFVCESPRPSPPLPEVEIPECMSEYFGVGPCAPIHEQCVPAEDVLGDFGDLSEEEALQALETCNTACASATTPEPCEDACVAVGIEPPPPASTCTDIEDAPLLPELCPILEWFGTPQVYTDPVTGEPVACKNAGDCSAFAGNPLGVVCGFARFCTWKPGTSGVPECEQHVDDDVPLSEGGKTGTVRVCGIPSPTCLTGPDEPDRCDSTPLICEPADARQAVETIIFPSGEPQPTSPAELFDSDPLPEPDLTVPIASWAFPCNPVTGCTTGDDTGQYHPYCKYRVSPDGEIENTLDPARNHAQGQNQNADGSPSMVDFEFDPRLDLNYRAKLGPLGLPDITVSAGAGLVATAVFHQGKLPFEGAFELVNVTARAEADRCSVTTDGSEIRLFGHDFLPSEANFERKIDGCEAAFDKFETYANRASKSLRDVATLLTQYDDLAAVGQRLDLSSLCEAGNVFDDPPADFPFPMNCDQQPPESHLNELIAYYERQVDQLLLAGIGLGDSGIALEDTVHVFEGMKGDEEVTLFTSNFLIGPVPVTLEAFIAASYGVEMSVEYRIKPGKAVSALLLPNAKTGVDQELLGVFITGGPYARAYLGFFAGAGFSAGPVAASIGIEANLTLGDVRVTVDGGAGLIMAGRPDGRPLGPDLDSLALSGSEPLIQPMAYEIKLGYSAGLGADIRDILSGDVNARLRLKFLWFSKTYRQRLLRFDGFCTQPEDLDEFPCHIPILELGGNATLAEFPWATIRMGQILPKLKYLPFVPEPDPLDENAPTPFAVDMTHLETLFYDRLCACVDPGDPCSSDGDCCNDLECADTGTGTKTCSCRESGESCATDGDCCSGLPCVSGSCQCTALYASCERDADCCGEVCNSVPGGGRCRCSGLNDRCAENADCCSGQCSESGLCVNMPE